MGTTPGSAEQRFPGFDVLAQAHTWDSVTTGVVLSRLTPVQPVGFFSPEEEPTARALVDRLLGQEDDPKIPVLEMIASLSARATATDTRTCLRTGRLGGVR